MVPGRGKRPGNGHSLSGVGQQVRTRELVVLAEPPPRTPGEFAGVDVADESGLAAPTVAFTTLGCKVNYSETEGLMGRFRARGFRLVPDDTPADVYVVNTCTVTGIADRKSRQAVRQAMRANPLGLVVATGCYVSVAGPELATLFPGNVMLVHNKHKDSLVDAVEQELLARGSCTSLAGAVDGAEEGHDNLAGPPAAPLLPAALALDGGRTRAVLKVQDGCNAGCAFCIIPRARGGPRSVPLAAAVEAARTLEAQGYREIVLAGILLGSYGQDLPGWPDLGTLLSRILAETRHLRLRISSIEPQDLRPDWLALWADTRLCRHLHLPLQSGSAATLAAMRRKYTPEDYATLVETARRAIPGLAVTADVMVGFPGEDEAQFAESVAFMRRIDFAGLHVFKYSARRGTPARRAPDQVDERVKNERSAVLRALGEEGTRAFHAAHTGATAGVLWERWEDGVWRGLTDNYLQARLADPTGSLALANTVMSCRLGRAEGATLHAEPLASRA